MDEVTETRDAPEIDPGLDTLYDEGVDHDAVERVEADLLMPGGSYRTVPVLMLDVYETKQGPHVGRRGFRFFGEIISSKPLSRNNGGEPTIVNGRISFKASPERRNRMEEIRGDDGRTTYKDTGKPDAESNRWANAVRAFTLAAGYKPGTNREVVEFIKNYPVGLRVGQIGVPTERRPDPTGEPGNVVYSIFPLRD